MTVQAELERALPGAAAALARYAGQTIVVKLGGSVGPGETVLQEIAWLQALGARPLRRAIQRELENEVSRLLLRGALQPDDRVRVDYDDVQLTFAFSVSLLTPLLNLDLPWSYGSLQQ